MNLFLSLFLSGVVSAEADWNSVRLYGHAFSNKEFDNEQLNFIAKHHSIMTIEKRHAYKDHGRGASVKATKVSAKEMVRRNPETKVLYYWNCALIYSDLYESLKNIHNEQPTWVRKSPYDNIKAAPYAFDFTEQAAQDFWVSTAADVVKDPNVTGTFVDAIPKAEVNGQIEVVRQMMDQLPGLVIYNGYRLNPGKKTFYGGRETLKHADGVFMEAFLSGPINDVSRAELVIEELLDFPKDKILICNGLADGYGSNGSHEFSLAAYLIVAQEKTYYRFGSGHAFGDEYLTYWHEDFGKKVGKPKGKAVKKGRVYKRNFENVEVTLDLLTQKATLDWK